MNKFDHTKDDVRHCRRSWATAVRQLPCCAGASPRGKKAARKAADEELRMRQLCHLDDLDAAVDGLPSGYVKIALDNGPFIVDLLFKDCNCPIVMLVYQRVIHPPNIPYNIILYTSILWSHIWSCVNPLWNHCFWDSGGCLILGWWDYTVGDCWYFIGSIHAYTTSIFLINILLRFTVSVGSPAGSAGTHFICTIIQCHANAFLDPCY